MKSKKILTMMIAGAVMTLATTASAEMANSGFETSDFSGWLTFGQGWRTAVGGDAYAGVYGAVNDVQTSDVDSFRGVFQNVPVTTGSNYHAGVYIRTVNIESSESWFELQWLDVNGGVIDQLQSAHVTGDQPFTLMKIADAVAPAGAVTASVRGIVFMPTVPTDNTDFHIFDQFFLVDASAAFALSIAPATSGVVELTWSTQAATYMLESTTNLVEGAWSAVPDYLGIVGDNFVVTNGVAAEGIFRLRSP